MRPTAAEKDRKLEDAKKALAAQDGLFAAPAAAAAELEKLKIGDSKEVWELIRKLLPEIQPHNYTGKYPPMPSVLSSIKSHELFSYSWFSKVLGQKMYIKFVIKNSRYYYVRLHKDEPEKREV